MVRPALIVPVSPDHIYPESVWFRMKSILKTDGRILLIDFHYGKPHLLKGWYSKLVIILSEIAAGRKHYRNYRHYISAGGLPNLIERSELIIEKSRIAGNNTLALYLLRLP